jgi:hypothetical protein
MDKKIVRLGREVKISPKSAMVINKEIDIANVKIYIGGEECDFVMSLKALENLRNGEEIHIDKLNE